MQTPDTVIDLAETYIKIYFIGMIPNLYYLSLIHIQIFIMEKSIMYSQRHLKMQLQVSMMQDVYKRQISETINVKQKARKIMRLVDLTTKPWQLMLPGEKETSLNKMV